MASADINHGTAGLWARLVTLFTALAKSKFQSLRQLVLLLAISLSGGASLAQTLEDIQRQSQGLEGAVEACGDDLNCLTKVIQEASGLYKDVLNTPEYTKLVDTPCSDFPGKLKCLSLKVRISHKGTWSEPGCTRADERFTYAYVYEGPGWLIHDTSRGQTYSMFTVPPPDGSWKLDLQHVEFSYRSFVGDCEPAGNYSFGREDFNFRNPITGIPTVVFSYDHGYTEPGVVDLNFMPLIGTASSRVKEVLHGAPAAHVGNATSSEVLTKASLTFSPADFDKLFEGQTLTRKLHWKGKPTLYRKESNELEIEIRPAVQKPSRCKIHITSPIEGYKLLFSKQSPGVAQVTFKARVTPSKYASKIRWKLPTFTSGTQVEAAPKSLSGPQIKVTFHKLPSKNSDLGPKVISASIAEKKCTVSVQRTVKLFFPRDATNNPGGSDPNWFYYWSQTSARPGSIKPKFYGVKCKANRLDSVDLLGYYLPKSLPNHYYVCDLVKKLNPAMKTEVRVWNFDATQKGFKKTLTTTTGIDTFALVCLHELEHFTHLRKWWLTASGNPMDKFIRRAKDPDADDFPTTKENAFNKQYGETIFDHNKKKTHSGFNDEELYTEIISHKKLRVGAADKEDWASPGKQWP